MGQPLWEQSLLSFNDKYQTSQILRGTGGGAPPAEDISEERWLVSPLVTVASVALLLCMRCFALIWAQPGLTGFPACVAPSAPRPGLASLPLVPGRPDMGKGCQITPSSQQSVALTVALGPCEARNPPSTQEESSPVPQQQMVLVSKTCCRVSAS